jgi:hypothetical protein
MPTSEHQRYRLEWYMQAWDVYDDHKLVASFYDGDEATRSPLAQKLLDLLACPEKQVTQEHLPAPSTSVPGAKE